MGLGLCACVLQTSLEREGAVFVLGFVLSEDLMFNEDHIQFTHIKAKNNGNTK